MEYAKQKLLLVLSAILNREVLSVSPTFHCALELFAFTLCRLPIWHGLVITPPVLKREGIISDNLLDEALKECEVSGGKLLSKHSEKIRRENLLLNVAYWKYKLKLSFKNKHNFSPCILSGFDNMQTMGLINSNPVSHLL